jgi:hypothetical protein
MSVIYQEDCIMLVFDQFFLLINVKEFWSKQPPLQVLRTPLNIFNEKMNSSFFQKLKKMKWKFLTVK